MQTLREELDIERRARTALERRLAREIALTEKRIKGHLCYRLGKESVACRHSPLAWAFLPRQLLCAYSDFRRDAREKAELRVKPASPALLKLYSTEGAAGIVEQLWQVAQEQDLSAEKQIALDRIFRHPVRQLSILNLVRQRSGSLVEPVSGRLCYLLHNSLPYSSGGYATRSHGLASALAGSDWEVVAVTRPGYPFDVTSGLTMAEVCAKDEIDGVTYIRCFEPARRGLAPSQYIELAAGVVERELRQLRPQVVVAASNYLTALPGLIAARRLGLPFFYEVRGLWEITRVSREPEFAWHINFWIQKSLEAAVARHADGVFTLTAAMREELASRGVPRARITLLPNCCNVAQFSPRCRDRELQAELAIPDAVPVIGYVGTFVGYEGLDDLSHACGLLKRRGATFRLLLVGNENASGSLRGESPERSRNVQRMKVSATG